MSDHTDIILCVCAVIASAAAAVSYAASVFVGRGKGGMSGESLPLAVIMMSLALVVGLKVSIPAGVIIAVISTAVAIAELVITVRNSKDPQQKRCYRRPRRAKRRTEERRYYGRRIRRRRDHPRSE